MKLINDKKFLAFFFFLLHIFGFDVRIEVRFSAIYTHEMAFVYTCQSHEGLIENVLNFKSCAFFCCSCLAFIYQKPILLKSCYFSATSGWQKFNLRLKNFTMRAFDLTLKIEFLVFPQMFLKRAREFQFMC